MYFYADLNIRACQIGNYLFFLLSLFDVVYQPILLNVSNDKLHNEQKDRAWQNHADGTSGIDKDESFFCLNLQTGRGEGVPETNLELSNIFQLQLKSQFNF
jgi:hypothetical protein